MVRKSLAPQTKQHTIGITICSMGNEILLIADRRWYFDSTSAATDASLIVTFYNDGPHGFPQGDVPLPLGVSVTGSWPNGTLFAFVTGANNATVINNANGISGIWEGAGARFTGTSLYGADPIYLITIESPGLDVYGTITYQAVSADPV